MKKSNLLAALALVVTGAIACESEEHSGEPQAVVEATAPSSPAVASPSAASTFDVRAHLDADKVDAASIPYSLETKFTPVAQKPLVVPAEASIPAGPDGELIKRGKVLLSNTYEELPEHVGNKLRCTTCHLNGGTTGKAAPWVGINARFPQYRDRSAKVDDLKTRINNCFQRSMNGTPLERDSDEMTAMVAYMNWLSQGYERGESPEGRGIPKLALEREPDKKHGEEVYTAKCAVCHGADGQGNYGADGKTYAFPALWGDGSFNVAAGMARLHTAAGFVKWNMPLGQGGTLTDDEAYDVAAFFSQQPRPDFAGKVNDWPKGNKPPDARY